jgi:citronellol/citronellal dehydrogenase
MADGPKPAVFPFAKELFAGQAALVTGGGTGLGRAIAECLARAGADLLLAARQVERLELAAKEIHGATGRRVETAFVNIRDRVAVEALEARARELFPRIDVLVNNAGGQFAQAARDFKPKGWNAVVDTNLTGTWNMVQVFGGRMLEVGGGVITNIIAVVGRGFPGLAHTAAARAGVLELTRTLAYEWGPSVRLNCVAPGAVETAGFRGAYDPNISQLFDGIPSARYGTLDEVAQAVTFMSSSAASYITGEVLYVAGGQQNYGRNQALFDSQLGRK